MPVQNGNSGGTGGLSRKVPVEEIAVAAGVNPGEQADDHVDRVGNVALASDIIEVTAEVGEGGEAAAGLDEALDDVVRFGRLVGIPVIGDSLGDAAES